MMDEKPMKKNTYTVTFTDPVTGKVQGTREFPKYPKPASVKPLKPAKTAKPKRRNLMLITSKEQADASTEVLRRNQQKMIENEANAKAAKAAKAADAIDKGVRKGMGMQ